MGVRGEYRWLFFFGLFLVAAPSAFSSHTSYNDYCYSSSTGTGDTWMEVKVTAGGLPAKKIQVSLETAQWQCGYGYAYENQCTDSTGVARFRKMKNPTSECYTTYYDYYGKRNYTYCNSWSNAHCYQECLASDKNSYYSCSNQTFATEGYRLRAAPTWNHSLSEEYGPATVDAITINFNQLQKHEVALDEKAIILRLRVQDDTGSPITSGVTVYASGNNTYFSKEIHSSFVDSRQTIGTVYVGAYCTNYQSCDYSCMTSQNITLEKGDVIKEVIIKAKKNNSIVTGRVVGSDGASLHNAYVNLNSANSYSYWDPGQCYASGYSQTDTNGRYTIRVPAGSYNAWVSPPYNYDYNSGSSSTPYASRQLALTLDANQTFVQDIVLTRKDAVVSGATKDGYGRGLKGASVSGWRNEEGQNDWFSATSQYDGSYNATTLPGRYNVNAYYWDSSTDYLNNRISNCSNEGMVTVQAPSSNVHFTFPVLDANLKVIPIDAKGQAVNSFCGGASIRPRNQDERNWCSRWISFDQGGRQTTVQSAAKLRAEIHSWSCGNGYDPINTGIDFVTGEPDGLTVLEVPVAAIDSKIYGNIADLAGNKVTGVTPCSSVFATRDNIWRSCQASKDSTYECKVSPGRWCVSYQGNWYYGYGSYSPGAATKCVDVAAGSSQQLDLTVLNVAYINVTAKDNQDKPVRAWIEASPHSNGDEGSAKHWYYYNRGCYTDTSGKCQIAVGASSEETTYYVTAYRSWWDMFDDEITLPEEVSVKIKEGETVDAPALLFRKFDGKFEVQVIMGNAATKSIKGIALKNPVLNSSKSLAAEGISDVWVSASSSFGGYSEGRTDENGFVELKCVSNDEWRLVAVSQVGKHLFISETATALCVPLPKTTDVTIKLNGVGDLPDTVTETWDAKDSKQLNVSDGFSISFPEGALGESGEVTCSIAGDPFLPYQSNKRVACKYGHDITCKDSSGNAITQLKSVATLCTPICDEQLANLDLEAKDLKLAYRDTSTDSYRNLEEVTINKEKKLACGTTDHFTEFVLIGNGDLSGVDGDTEDSTEEADRTGEPESGYGAAGGGGGGGGCSLNPRLLLKSQIAKIKIQK